MKVNNNTILTTGGAKGIGKALGKQFIASYNLVIVCGRRKARLNEAKAMLSSLITIQCYTGNFEQRRKFFKPCIATYPELNIVINNSSI